MRKILHKLISGIIVTVVGGYILVSIEQESSSTPSISNQTIQNTRQVNETTSSSGLLGGSIRTSTSITETSNISQMSSGNGTNINVLSKGGKDSPISINISGSGEDANINVTTEK